VRTCGAVTAYQNQVIGYDVVYEYNGQTYSARVAQPPGARIALQVMPADAQAPGVDAPPPAAPPVAVYSQPVSPYPPYYAAYPAPYPYVPYAVVRTYGYVPYPYYDARPKTVVGARWGGGGGHRH
jgi:hypothetical protein